MRELLVYCILASTFLAMQYLVVFKCINIEHRRRQLLAVTVIYTLAYITISFFLGTRDDFDTSQTIQFLYNVNHTLNTFILLLIVSVGSSEFLPRNFLVITFYYDFLSLVPWPHELLVSYLIKRFEAQGLDVTGNIYSNEPHMIIILAVNYVMLVLMQWCVYMLFNRYLKRLITRIPDYICTIVMLTSFFLYVFRSVGEFKNTDVQVDYRTYAEGNLPYLADGLLCLSIILVVLLVIYTYRRAVIRRIQETEVQFQFLYYANAAEIYSEVRHLRHDLANHMAVIEAAGTEPAYGDSLLAVCSGIREKTARQLAWQDIDLDMLSSREKFEIYQFAGLLAKKLKKEKAEFEPDKDNGKLRIYICGRHCSPLRLLLLKSRMEYRLIKAIAGQHLGDIWLNNTEKDGTECLVMALAL